MTEPPACLSIGELADYWTADVSSPDAERIETHVFECADCARRLEEADVLRRGIATAVRSGAFQAFVTDDVLNQLARDGVRVRSYTLDPGAVVPCAAWADDEVVVARLRADFTGVHSVTALMWLETGEELERALDMPVREGAREMILALSAASVRAMPSTPIRLTLVGTPAPEAGDVIAEYVFDHRGAHARRSP
jgi:hypothetical protein